LFPIYIYALVGNRDRRQKPWYVGQALDPYLRLTVDHLNPKKFTKSKKSVWIQKERAAGKKVSFRLLQACTNEATADARECHWIEICRAVNPKLTNGGNGNRRALKASWKAYLQKAALKYRKQLAADKKWRSTLLAQ
jgi:GIY-YIG catalytic domain-containing protein